MVKQLSLRVEREFVAWNDAHRMILRAGAVIVRKWQAGICIAGFPGLLSNLPVSCLESPPAKAGLLLKGETWEALQQPPASR